MRTVICHFFNEEFLLPWWLKHHKHVFDHGIMIDYASTDRSCDIIREICPSWEIRPSRNQYFDSISIDQEVMDIEAELSHWRMALNVTEFLYGNFDNLLNDTGPTQYFIGNYVFVDTTDLSKIILDKSSLDYNAPIYKQRYWGYDEFNNVGGHKGGVMGRMNRSIHNYPIEYTPGRHFNNGGDPDRYKQSFDDLVIFYYGWVDSSRQGISRKTQIKNKISEKYTVHHRSEQQFIDGYISQQSLLRDLNFEIAPIIEHNFRTTGSEW